MVLAILCRLNSESFGSAGADPADPAAVATSVSACMPLHHEDGDACSTLQTTLSLRLGVHPCVPLDQELTWVHMLAGVNVCKCHVEGVNVCKCHVEGGAIGIMAHCPARLAKHAVPSLLHATSECMQT